MNNQKPKHLVIDTSGFNNYTRRQKLYRLIDAIFTYNLIVYISPELIDELEQTIPATSVVELPQLVYDGYLDTIKSACILFEPVLQYNVVRSKR
ncbi:MAG: hypothetical protein JWQ09_169 [Segetibacter sp.]|nr:hypothetical protein [Segetibacter sp.]